MPRRRRRDTTADVAYLRPIVERLGADEVHVLVDLTARQIEEEDEDCDPGRRPRP